MTLTLTLREEPVVPLEAEALSPDHLASANSAEIQALPVWHGNERTRLGEFFDVSGSGDDVRLEGDLSRVKFVGAGMRGGRLVVRGSAGRQLGGAYPGERAGMRGGEIVVHGDAGAQAGVGLRRGLIAVAGRVGEAAGLRMLAGTIVALGGLGAPPG